MRSVESRLGGYLDQNKLIADKLTTQDFALTQLHDSAASTKQAIEEAIAKASADAASGTTKLGALLREQLNSKSE